MNADLSSNFVCSVLLYPTLSIGSGQESPWELFFHFRQLKWPGGYSREPTTIPPRLLWKGTTMAGCVCLVVSWQHRAKLDDHANGTSWYLYRLFLLDWALVIGDNSKLQVIQYCHLFVLLTGWIFCLCCNLLSRDDNWEALDLRRGWQLWQDILFLLESSKYLLTKPLEAYN